MACKITIQASWVCDGCGLKKGTALRGHGLAPGGGLPIIGPGRMRLPACWNRSVSGRHLCQRCTKAELRSAIREEQAARLKLPAEEWLIEDLGIPERALWYVRRGNIRTVRDLLTAGEEGLLTLRGFGKSRLGEVRDACNQAGLQLPLAGYLPGLR
ncbi:MAG: DNA-directed RNA polymerase subunit alpha C-terminal domain-containing protein [Actinomycetota bacterium]